MRIKCKVAREVKVFLFQCGALVSNFVRMKCNVVKDSVEVKLNIFFGKCHKMNPRKVTVALDPFG